MRFLFRCLSVLFAGILAFAALAADCAGEERGDAAKIKSMEKKWAESYKQRKIDLLASLLADDFVITVEDGSTYSKTGYISHTADTSTQVEAAELSDPKVHMHGNIAVVTGAYHEKGRSNGRAYEYNDRLTDVWMKSGESWQVIASHYSVPVK